MTEVTEIIDNAIESLRGLAESQDSVFMAVADRLATIESDINDSDVFNIFASKCVRTYPNLFGTSDKFRILLYVGQGTLPPEAIDASHIAASYVIQLHGRYQSGKISESKLNKVFEECYDNITNLTSDPIAPIYKALGISKVKAAKKKPMIKSVLSVIDCDKPKNGKRIFLHTNNGKVTFDPNNVKLLRKFMGLLTKQQKELVKDAINQYNGLTT